MKRIVIFGSFDSFHRGYLSRHERCLALGSYLA